MKKGLVYLVTLIFLFLVVAGTLKTNFPTISFFLAMLVSLFIIDKTNGLLIFMWMLIQERKKKLMKIRGNSQ
ncbi:hypothetical protein GCM10011351_28990 [Paraliobacillus quinghaiensis]|uniref:Uncharacterized protein n=1 Tax=Paraliobacillus quinghaiensis TaxID=470815 RepID=A0A917TX56_9BACI|nr:hypothetical protein [Paraliobacillus quinghaiensis]GGM40977.1 hypothetical protein GCM10011351_28990 [Paraliobacillus quinghaiensis]